MLFIKGIPLLDPNTCIIKKEQLLWAQLYGMEAFCSGNTCK